MPTRCLVQPSRDGLRWGSVLADTNPPSLSASTAAVQHPSPSIPDTEAAAHSQLQVGRATSYRNVTAMAFKSMPWTRRRRMDLEVQGRAPHCVGSPIPDLLPAFTQIVSFRSPGPMRESLLRSYMHHPLFLGHVDLFLTLTVLPPKLPAAIYDHTVLRAPDGGRAHVFSAQLRSKPRA